MPHFAWPRLTRDRVIGYATLLALTEFAAFAFFVAGAHGLIVPMEQQGSTDFLSFHAAGALVNAGSPWLVYDRAAHQAAEFASVGFATSYNYFYYPPVFLLICAPLARLPYLVAFVVFQTIGAAACFSAARLIRRDLPVIVFLAFPGFWWAIGTGQNALLTAALFAAGTALIDRRPWLAGLCLGALCYKPHFGVLIPVALIAGGHWRAVLGAAGSVIGLAAVSLALFGAGTWTAFFAAAASSGEVYGGHAIFMSGLTSPYGVLMSLGLARGTALAVQAAVILAAAALVGIVWRRHEALPLRAAVLLAATPAAVPVMMFYDLMLVFVALVWLSRLNVPRLAMAAVFVMPLFSGNLGDNHIMFAAITATGAVALALWAARPARTPAAAPLGV